MKRCSKCGKSEEEVCFQKDPRNKTGLRSECNVCRNELRKAQAARVRAELAQFRALKASGKLAGLLSILLLVCAATWVDDFESCRSGPGIPYKIGCAPFDEESDGDVDQSDFGIIQTKTNLDTDVNVYIIVTPSNLLAGIDPEAYLINVLTKRLKARKEHGL